MRPYSDNHRWLGYRITDLTLGRVLSEKSARNGERTYIHDLANERRISYRELDSTSHRVANGLHALGVEKGTHVAVMMENSPEYVELLFALARLGAVAALINPSARGDILQHYITLSDATVACVDVALLDRISELGPGITALNTLIVVNGVGQALPQGVEATARISDFESLKSAPDTPVEDRVLFCDPAHIIFTSGTTGPSKGVLYTHARSLLYGLDFILGTGCRESDIVHGWNPLFHVGGLHCVALSTMLADATWVMPRRFSVSNFWREVRESRATMISLIGATVNMMWSQAPSPEDRNHNVRTCSTTPMPPFALDFEKRFGVRLTTGYGLTDYGMPTSFLVSDPATKLGSAGRTRDGWEVRIVDGNDFDVPAGGVGEIVIRCNIPWGMSSGYYNNSQATVTAWRNGWFHSGDRGFLDDDGYLWFSGRGKDMIRRSGENISAYEIERVLMQHPAISEAAAFAVNSPMLGEEVAVAVILNDGASPDAAKLIEYCTRKMPHFMVPRYVQFVNDLPRNLSQKVQKFKLREDAEGNLSLWWDRESAETVVR